MANKQRITKVGFPTQLRKYGRGQNVCGSKIIGDFLELQSDGSTMRFLVVERAEDAKPAVSKLKLRKPSPAQRAMDAAFPAAEVPNE